MPSIDDLKKDIESKYGTKRYNRLTAEERKNLDTDINTLEGAIAKELTIERANIEKVEDLKDIPVSLLIRETGDGRPALMGHINSLARRIEALERLSGEFDGIAKPVRDPGTGEYAEATLESPLRAVATVSDIAADEEFVVAKKKA